MARTSSLISADSSHPTSGPGRGKAAAISVRGLVHRYGERTALDGLSCEVQAGEIFGFLGPNGSGKTTLFKILSTLLEPAEGEAEVFGLDLSRRPGEVRALLGVAFQNPAVDGKLTCRENLLHHGRLYGLSGRSLAARASQVLGQFRLSGREHDTAEKLSGGLRRRLELAKAVIHRPRLLVLDEPATGLDPAARQDLWHDLENLQSTEGVTVALTTHLMEEADRCDRLAILNEGRVVVTGSPDRLKEDVGGEVLYIETDRIDEVVSALRERFGASALLVDDKIRVEDANAHRFVPELIESFSGVIKSVQLSRPSLEEVFVHATGKTFRDFEQGQE